MTNTNDLQAQRAIRLHLELGEEDLARDRYGDQAVDEYIAQDLGITAAQLRDGTLDGINGVGA